MGNGALCQSVIPCAGFFQSGARKTSIDCYAVRRTGSPAVTIGIYLENYRAGGLDRMVIDLVNLWAAKEDHFILFCNDNHEGLVNLKQEIGRVITYVTYKAPGCMRRQQLCSQSRIISLIDRAVYASVGSFVAMLWEIPRLVRLFKRNRLDILMVHNGGWPGARTARSAAIAGWLIRKKTLLVIHNLARPHHALIRWQEHLLETLLCWLGCSVVTVSQAARESLRRYTQLPAATLIYYGVRDLTPETQSETNQQDLRSELGIGCASFLIAMFGTFETRRGHSMLMEVMERLLPRVPNSVLLIVGAGRPLETDHILGMIRIKDLEDHVYLLGFRTDVVRIMHAIDVAVNPVQEYESFGLVSVEAMAMKKPVVSTGVGGIPEVVQDGVTGFLVPQNDPELFASRLIELAQDPELRRAMGEAGYQRYLDRFRAERMALDYYNLVVVP